MFKAIADRIIVKLQDGNEGKVLYEVEPKYTNAGIVQSVGDRVRGVKPGDRVIFHLFDELPLPEEGFAVIRQKSLLGIWE